MGSFSFLKAKVKSNEQECSLRDGYDFKLLIPQEFGGGSIKAYYQDYGIGAIIGKGQFDLYEVVAFWNNPLEVKGIDRDSVFPLESENTDFNRGIGIRIACWDKDHHNLKYPLKLVSVDYNKSYEECVGISYEDSTQGWKRIGYTRWLKEMKKIKKELI